MFLPLDPLVDAVAALNFNFISFLYRSLLSGPLKEGVHTIGKSLSNIVLADAPSSPAHIGRPCHHLRSSRGASPAAAQNSKAVLISVSMTNENGRSKPITIRDLTLMATPPRELVLERCLLPICSTVIKTYLLLLQFLSAAASLA